MIEHITKTDVLNALQIGQENAQPMVLLVKRMTGEDATEGVKRHVRELIHDLRLEGHHICAHPAHGGYFIAQSADELNETCKFLTDRALTTLRQVAAMKRVSLPDLYGQMNLPT